MEEILLNIPNEIQPKISEPCKEYTESISPIISTEENAE